MPVHNSDVSDILREVADLLEIKDANEFRVRAYRNAAQSIDNLSGNIADWVEEEKDLTKIAGIGESIAEKIEEIVRTGTLEQLEQITETTPEELSDLMSIENLGPKKVSKLHEELDVDSPEDLKEAVEKKKVRKLEGFGEKTEKKIRKNLDRELEERRTKLSRAEEYAEPLVNYLKTADEVNNVIVAGSYRRKEETVGDLDILASCSDSESVMDHFAGHEDVKEIVAKGETKSTVRLRNDLQVDLRVVDEESFGSALLYFTGSKEHNIKLRERALDNDLKINEYGVFPDNDNDVDDESIAGKTEEEVYESIDLPYIPPELRENRGEIETAIEGKLPDLIHKDDLRGDIHMHSTATDGSASVREMAEAALDLGYDYIAITDHSKRVTVANGLDSDDILGQIDHINEINEELDGLEILKGIEVDILEDGSLDLPNDTLEKLDVVIGSVHYKFELSLEKQTDRYLKAMDNPHLQIIGHPTGRRINKRNPMDLDLEKIFKRAADSGIHFELNASPQRLDLNDRHCKAAKEMGLKISIASDAHSMGELHKIKYGVYQARRGWLEKDDVINTLSLDNLKKALSR